MLKGKINVNFSTEHATKAHRGSRGVALLFLQPRRYIRCVVNTKLRALFFRESPGTQCIGVWEGPTADMDKCGKFCHYRDSITGPSRPQRVAISAELSRLSMLQGFYTLCMLGHVMMLDQKITNSVPVFNCIPLEIIKYLGKSLLQAGSFKIHTHKCRPLCSESPRNLVTSTIQEMKIFKGQVYVF